MTATIRLETRPLADLRPYERNAKPHPQSQLDAIKASIQRFGFRDPIGVTEDGRIVEGHGRALAAAQLGMAEVLCIVLPSTLTDDQIDLYRIAHNKHALSSTFDFALLVEELRDIVADTASFTDMGFTLEAAEGLFSMMSETVPALGNGGRAPVEAGADFEVVWETDAQRDAWKAFSAKAVAHYGGPEGAALVKLMADIRSGKLVKTGMEQPATAENVEGLEWLP